MKEFWVENEHINLNLTSLAQKTISADCEIFSASSSNGIYTRSTFINQVITNYDYKYGDNDDGDFPLDKNLIRLKERGSYFKMRLNKDAIDKLTKLGSDSSFLNKHDFHSCPQYIKCVLEAYARLPFIQREELILKNRIIEPIKNALARKQMLSIKYKGKNKDKDEELKVSPIRIVPAKEGTFQYLIAMKDNSVIPLRLSRIQWVKPLRHEHAIDISDDINKQIIDSLAEYGPTFIKEPVVKIKVKFTDNGLASYKYSVIHRPMHVAVEANNVYVFKCSEMQAKYFFFRFVGDATILEPASLRDEFKKLYESGLKNYN